MLKRGLLIFIVIGCLTVTAVAQKKQLSNDDFEDNSHGHPPSAYRIDITTPNSDGTDINRFYVDNNRVCYESPAGNGQLYRLMEIGKDEGKLYSKITKVYFDSPGSIAMLRIFFIDRAYSKYLGKETVNGKSCDKYQTTTITEPGIFLNSFFYFWIDPSTQLPVKSESSDKRYTYLWVNAVIGEQPKNSFELPPGYRKIDSPLNDPNLTGKPNR